jgi:phage shock protein PspC (stress-responsive transcriptional regulator)
MEKIITVNIHHKEYKLTESAFRLLEDYNGFIKRTVKDTEKIYDIEIQISVIIDMESNEKGKDFIVNADVIKEVIKVLRDNQTVLYQMNEDSKKKEDYKNSGFNYKQSDIRRDTKNGVLGGVCSGLAKKMNIEPLVIRILFVVLTVIFGIFLLVYIVLWIVIPEDKELVNSTTYNEKK